MKTTPSLHLVDDDGHLASPINIAKFLNQTVANVPQNASEDDLNASSSPVKMSPLSLKSTLNSSYTNADSTLRAASALIHLHIKQMVGVKYHVVGVFGGQSSGKSTLLNLVFGTTFQTMNEDAGRHQTTKGAFLAVTDSANIGKPTTDVITSPIMVVDFEGTDGAERGENQSFERQLSLFALSIADTLIINMWAMEVGRFNGANLSLLRTVFEVNLQLFSHDANLENEKPTLLFVMRDHTAPDITANAARIRESIDRIWESIHKPAGREGCTIDRLFNIEYFGFPHYELQNDKFMDAIGTFRSMFSPDGEKQVFRSPNTFRGIPLEALPPYLHNCWQAILKSKDLDIPSQREMLSRFRCKDLADEQLATFRHECDGFIERMQAKGELINQLKDTLQANFQARIDAYVEETKLYSPSIGKDHQDRLENEMHHVYEDTMKVYCEVMVSDAVRNIDGEIHTIIDDCIKVNVWSNEAVLATMRLPLGTATGANDNDFTDRHLRAAVSGFWKSMEQRIRKLCDKTADPSKLAIFGRSQQLLEDDEDLREMVTGRLVVAIEDRIRKRLEGMASDASVAMQKTFEYVLNHEDSGAMKIFDSVTDLQRRFRVARIAGLVLVACIFYYRLRVDDALVNNSDENDDDAPLDSDEDIEISLSKTQTLFAKTVKAFTAARVSFAENDHEAKFQLKVGSAHVSPEPAEINGSTNGLPGDMEYPSLPKALLDVLSSPRGAPSGDAPVTEGSAAFTPRGDRDASNNNNVSLHNILLSKSALKRALELYFQQIYFAFQIQTKNVEARGNGNHIPVWMWGLLLYLGYDDVLNLLFNPVLLIILVLTVAFFFNTALQSQWEKFEKDGPPVVVHALKMGYSYAQPYIEEVRKATMPLAEIGKEEDAAAAPKAATASHVDPNRLDASAVAAAKKAKQD